MVLLQVVSRFQAGMAEPIVLGLFAKFLEFLPDKRDDFDFAIVNFPILCSIIPLSPAYGVYISQLIRYARACFACEDFSKRCKLLTNKLMFQGYNESRLKSSFRKFYGRYNDLVCDYKLSLAHMLNDLFHTI